MSTIPLCTHIYIGLRNSCWAEISVFLMVIHDCTYASFSVKFLRAVVVVLVIAVLVWIYFVVVVFFSHVYAQKVFFVLFTGVLNTITHECRRGIEVGVSSWSTVGSCF